MTDFGPNDLDIATIDRSIAAINNAFVGVEMDFQRLEKAFARELLNIHRADMDLRRVEKEMHRADMGIFPKAMKTRCRDREFLKGLGPHLFSSAEGSKGLLKGGPRSPP